MRVRVRFPVNCSSIPLRTLSSSRPPFPIILPRVMRAPCSLRVTEHRALNTFTHLSAIHHPSRDSLPAYKYMKVSRFVGSSHRAGVSHLVECWGGADLIMAAVKDADQHQSQVPNVASAAFRESEIHSFGYRFAMLACWKTN